MDIHAHESDDEIFCGKISLKEVKTRLLGNKNHEVLRCSKVLMEKNSYDESLKIIEMHSEPNLSCSNPKPSTCQLSAVSNPVIISPPLSSSKKDIKPSDDSFVKEEINVYRKEDNDVDSENTLSNFNCVVNNKLSPNYEYYEDTDRNQTTINNTCTEPIVLPKSEYKSPTDTENKIDAIVNISNELCGTPTKSKTEETNVFVVTPCSGAKTKLSVFRTPGIPVAQRKTPASLIKKTPSKIKGYDHIVSPVASYINNSPIVPLFKNVRPTKPLPGPSAIPKLKSSHCKVENKENEDLPTLAYKPAKMTKVVDVPNDEKLPQNQWAKKISSSLPRPVVMRHDYRQTQSRPLVSQQEDSFGDLPLQQADLSVCTQKTAVNIKKKFNVVE